MAAQIRLLELVSADFQRTASFYERLCGWAVCTEENGAARQGAEAQLRCVKPERAQAAGVLPHISVANLLTSLAEVEAAGGRILARPSTPDAVAIIADPDGNVLALQAGVAAVEKQDPAQTSQTSSDRKAPRPRPVPKAAAAVKAKKRKPRAPHKP